MLLVVTVTGWLALEVVTLHRSCETFSAAHSSDVNAVANGELVDGDLLANLKAIDRIEADFDESVSWLNSSLRIVTGVGLVEFAGISVPVGDL